MAFISSPIWGSSLETQFGLGRLCSPLALRLWKKIYSSNGHPVNSSKTHNFLLNPSWLWQDEVAHSLCLCHETHSASTQPRPGPSPAPGTSVTENPS